MHIREFFARNREFDPREQRSHECAVLCHCKSPLSLQRLALRTIGLAFSSRDLGYLDPSRHGHRRSGSQGGIGDVALAAGRMPPLGVSLAGEANKVIDAPGLAVTPGFINIKTHSDFILPINPKAESKVRQGVTTEIIGHCGFSVAPVLQGKTPGS